MDKAKLEVCHPLCPASLSSGPPLCLAAGMGSSKGGARLAAYSQPIKGGGIFLIGFLLTNFFLCPFSPFLVPDPSFWPIRPPSPVLFFLLCGREGNPEVFLQKLKCLGSPRPLCVVTVTLLARITRKGIENWEGGVKEMGETFLFRCSTGTRWGKGLWRRKCDPFSLCTVGWMGAHQTRSSR